MPAIAGRRREAGDPRGIAEAAAEAFNSGDRPAAADLYKEAIARSPDDLTTWTGLTRALLGTRPDGNDYELARDAVSAALNAYLLTRNEAARAQTLALMAAGLERLSEFRPALEAYKASLEIQDSESVRKDHQDQRPCGGSVGKDRHFALGVRLIDINEFVHGEEGLAKVGQAALRVLNACFQINFTGRKALVYLAPVPLLCCRKRRSMWFVVPV